MDIWKDFQTVRYWKRFAVSTFSGIGFFSVLLGLFDIIFPGILPHGGDWLAVSVVTVSIFYGEIRAWPRPIKEAYTSPNTQIRLIKGDLFDQSGHLVIGMCTTFDTEIPDIIARASIQGQFLNRLFDGNTAELDSQLTKALSGYSRVGTIQKPGKQDRYPVGTVATLRQPTRKFFCVAYTEMNERNEARGTMDGIWRSLHNLWKEIGCGSRRVS